MRDILLPAMLLCVSSGLMIGLGKAWVPSVSVAAVAAAASGAIRWSAEIPAEGAFAAAWIAIIASAAVILLGGRISRVLTLPMAVATGAVMGLLGPDWRIPIVFAALPIVVTVARFVVARHWALAIKVIAGWLLAIATLNASLSMLPVTPGYLPDHLE
nr:hypothetical protein [uncultured Sphingomonas sp.]